MITFKDLITGDISDSPSDRLAAPLLLFIAFPIVAPCTIVYYSAKGVKYLGEKAIEKIATQREAKKVIKESMDNDKSEEFIKNVSMGTEVKQTSIPIAKTGSKKPKRLLLTRNDKGEKHDKN